MSTLALHVASVCIIHFVDEIVWRTLLFPLGSLFAPSNVSVTEDAESHEDSERQQAKALRSSKNGLYENN